MYARHWYIRQYKERTYRIYHCLMLFVVITHGSKLFWCVYIFKLHRTIFKLSTFNFHIV